MKQHVVKYTTDEDFEAVWNVHDRFFSVHGRATTADNLMVLSGCGYRTVCDAMKYYPGKEGMAND